MSKGKRISGYTFKLVSEQILKSITTEIHYTINYPTPNSIITIQIFNKYEKIFQ